MKFFHVETEHGYYYDTIRGAAVNHTGWRAYLCQMHAQEIAAKLDYWNGRVVEGVELENEHCRHCAGEYSQ